MRLPSAPILTIFTLLGSVFAHAINFPRQNSAVSTVSSPNSTSPSSSSSIHQPSSSSSSPPPSTTPVHTSSTSPSPTPTPTPTPTSSSRTRSTSSTTAPQPSPTQTSLTSVSSTQPTLSTTSPASSSSSSSFALSDSTNTRFTSPTTFTSTFRSVASDGSSVTITAVVAQPTDPINNVSTARQGFFANTGAVAGTFVVVGLVATGLFLCVFMWALRRYQRRRRDQIYFEEEYREFNHQGLRSTTPEATLPALRDSSFSTPVPPSPAPNMIERLHGNESVNPNAYYDRSQYQAQPGEFDPYQTHPYASHPYASDGSPHGVAYAYQPDAGPNRVGGPQGVSDSQHAALNSVDSFYQAQSGSGTR